MKSALVIGLGRFGRHTALKLMDLGIEVLGVDISEKQVESIVNDLTGAVVGDCTDLEFLKSLGVSNFDLCVVSIADDFLVSLEATFYLKELGAPMVVARASRDTQEKFLLRNGADGVVYPERMMGEWTAVSYSSKHIFDYIRLSKDIAMYEVSVPTNWIGKTISSVDVRKHYQLNIIAVKKGEDVIPSPGPDYEFKATEKVLIIGTDKQIKRIFPEDYR